MLRLAIAVLVPLCLFRMLDASEYFCDADRFPLVTDLMPDDCDNEDDLYYRENIVGGCFPGCQRATGNSFTCGPAALCPPGQLCQNNRCVMNDVSCYRFYLRGVNDKYTRAMWKPDCLPDESWAPKQCKGERANGRCFCFDPQGNRIFGEAFSYEADDMTCACSRRRAELERAGDYFFVSMHCDSMGNYDPLQCDVSSDQCWCVQPKTGDVVSAVLPGSMMSRLPCYNATTVGSQYLRRCESQLYGQRKIADEFAAHGTQRVNFPTVICQYDGSYGPYKILNGIVYCVTGDASNIGSYQTVLSSTQDPVNCNCARDEKRFSDMGLASSLSCAVNGNYESVQMDDDFQYYCVDQDGFIKSDKTPTRPNCDDFM